jgi:FkbM family methyltransferase
MNRSMRLAISAFLLVDVAVLLSFWSPPRLFGLKLLGRSGGCAIGATLERSRDSKLETELKDDFKRNRHVVDRGPDGIELWDTPRGRIWSPAGDQIIPYILAEQEMRIYGSALRGVRKGDVILDCGANLGLFTRTALASGAALVVAIEPAPVTLECLRRNMAAEIAQGRVVVYPKGVWDHDDVLKMYVDQTNAGSNSFLLDQNRPYVRLPVTTIDNIVAELKVTKVDFIKMDIEGSEKWALRGAHDTLLRYMPRMAISTEHLADDAVAIPALVHSLDPRYRAEASDCLDFGLSVRPQVVFFY